MLSLLAFLKSLYKSSVAVFSLERDESGYCFISPARDTYFKFSDTKLLNLMNRVLEHYGQPPLPFQGTLIQPPDFSVIELNASTYTLVFTDGVRISSGDLNEFVTELIIEDMKKSQ